MNYLMVDDERNALDELLETFRMIEKDCEPSCFTSPKKALEFAKMHGIDIAFLDIEMGTMDGITLAKELKDLHPNIKIIFVTGHDKYALNAIQIRATGYLIKPVAVEDIRRELTFIYDTSPSKDKCVTVQMFGGFALFVNGIKIKFSRSKSLELLAYVIDKQGAAVTTREACAVLWEDAPYNTAQKNHFHQIVRDIKSTLKEHDISEIWVQGRNSYSIKPSLLDCDSYRFFEGDTWAINRYRHNYLPSYSWAEFRVSYFEP